MSSTESVVDLWPQEFLAGKTDVLAPVAVVRQQAQLLEKHTSGIVKAEVISVKSEQNFQYSFNLYVPKLNYRFRLFSMIYGATLYPVELDIDGGVQEEIISQMVSENDNWVKRNAAWEVFSKVESEVVLIERLRTLFGAKKTKTIIQSLIAQAKV